MAEQKKDISLELQNIKNEILLTVGEKIDKNFKWIIAVYLGTFIPTMVAIFSVILTLESNNHKQLSALQVGLEKVSMQVNNLMAQSFPYEFQGISQKASVNNKSSKSTTAEKQSSNQK